MSFAVPFAAVAGTTLKNGAALAVVLLISLLPTALLHFLFAERIRLPLLLSAPITTMVSMLLVSMCCALIAQLLPGFVDSLGIYVYLLAAYPVVATVLIDKRASTVGRSLLSALRIVGVFTVLVMSTSLIREFFAYNQLWGRDLHLTWNWLYQPAMRLPFAGLIVLGLVSAIARGFRGWMQRAWAALRRAEKEEE